MSEVTLDFTETIALIKEYDELMSNPMLLVIVDEKYARWSELPSLIDDSYARITGNDPHTVRGVFASSGGEKFIRRIVAEHHKSE